MAVGRHTQTHRKKESQCSMETSMQVFYHPTLLITLSFQVKRENCSLSRLGVQLPLQRRLLLLYLQVVDDVMRYPREVSREEHFPTGEEEEAGRFY